MRQNVTECYFPEDLTLEEYKAKVKSSDGLYKTHMGITQEEMDVQVTNNWLHRKRTIAEDLYGIRQSVLETLPVDGDVFTINDIRDAVDRMAVSTLTLFSPHSNPSDDKYLLQNYVMHSGKDDKGDFHVIDDVRSAKVNIGEYFALVNT